MKSSTTLSLGLVAALILTFFVWVVSTTFTDVQATLLPDQGAGWYYWKLPDPTLITRLSVWIPYIVHQVGFWALIWKAQRSGITYQKAVHPINIVALLWNAAFVIVHLIQSYWFYDGLAQDVPIWSSQGSVILMLVWIIFMLNDERGIFLGKKAPFKQHVVDFAKKYHGYIFAWAITYTFWYHPTEGTFGHLVGFFYMFLLLLQGSLFFTTLHVNRYWRVFLETLVLFHAVTVAINQGTRIWPMFLFGFWGSYILIYLWGMKLSKISIWINIAVFALAWIVVWSQMGFSNAHQTLWIPIIYYVSVFLLYGILFTAIKIKNVFVTPSS